MVHQGGCGTQPLCVSDEENFNLHKYNAKQILITIKKLYAIRQRLHFIITFSVAHPLVFQISDCAQRSKSDMSPEGMRGIEHLNNTIHLRRVDKRSTRCVPTMGLIDLQKHSTGATRVREKGTMIDGLRRTNHFGIKDGMKIIHQKKIYIM